MTQFTKIFHHAIPKTVCNTLIKEYESRAGKERFEHDLKPQFTQVTLTWEESKTLLSHLMHPIREYALEFPYLPQAGKMEIFRIKKYEPNTDDQFDWHCDSIDENSSSRYLAILVYLNDVESDGETEFLDVKIKPEAGSVLLFPPFWTHPHRGLPVRGSHPKYILSTYFRY